MSAARYLVAQKSLPPDRWKVAWESARDFSGSETRFPRQKERAKQEIRQYDGTPLSPPEICPFRIRLIRRMKKERMLSALSGDAPVIRPLWKHEERKKDLMKYLLLFCATPEELAVWQTLSEEARAQTRAKSAQWMSEHRDMRDSW
ncbi:MAG TPA: hypothetical protein VF447_16055 [Terriglobales bacterium]